MWQIAFSCPGAEERLHWWVCWWVSCHWFQKMGGSTINCFHIYVELTWANLFKWTLGFILALPPKVASPIQCWIRGAFVRWRATSRQWIRSMTCVMKHGRPVKWRSSWQRRPMVPNIHACQKVIFLNHSVGMLVTSFPRNLSIQGGGI